MGKSAPSAPAAPDPAKLAAAQGAANFETAKLQGQINRVNQISPWGNITYAPNPQNQQWIDAELAKAKEFRANAGTLDSWDEAADRKYFAENSPFRESYNMTTTLLPEQQALLNSQTTGQGLYADAAVRQLQLLSGQLSEPFQGQPFADRASSAGAVASNAMNSVGGLPAFVDPTTGWRTTAGNIGSSALNQANALAGQPVNTDYNAVRQGAIDAANSRLDPMFARDEESMRARLLASGHAEGSQGWKNAYSDFNQGRNDARMQTILNAENLAGQSIQQTGALRGIPMGELNQLQGMAGNQTSVAGAAQGQAMSGYQMPFQTAQNQAALAGQAANLANLGFQQAIQTRAQPLNETSALLTGNMVQTPQAQQVPQTQVAPTDVIGPAMGAYNGALQAYGARQQAAAANMGGLYGLAGTGLMAGAMFASDRRLKTDIEKIGKTPGGSNVYNFRYKDDPSKTTYAGVMAQELLKKRPEAVGKVGGHYVVDYSQVV
jgi:hypothetical protein